MMEVKSRIIIMKPKNVVKWKQTGPGIWTRMPDGESPRPKGPTRKLPSSMAIPQLAQAAPQSDQRRRVLTRPVARE
jgi:hypothetical protein